MINVIIENINDIIRDFDNILINENASIVNKVLIINALITNRVLIINVLITNNILINNDNKIVITRSAFFETILTTIFF